MLDFFRINEWQKIDLRVGQIVRVENIKGADKLYKLRVDLGQELGERIVCAGLKENYSKDELQGKKVIFFANLLPKKLKGIESQGMILAAVNDNHSKVHLIQPDKNIEVGSSVN